MADSSLDDFFAKKDKSKKKGKSKVTPNELLEKQKVKKKKTTSEKKKEENKPQQIEVDPSKLTGIKDDEEWLEVQEEEVDYSGLRIQNLQLAQEKEEEEKDSEDKGSDEDDDEFGERKEGTSGPWGKIETPTAAPPQKPPAEPEPEPKKEDTPAKPAKYIPPGARQAAAAQTQLIGPGMGPSRRGRKTAPNLESEEDFPTLGTEAPVIDSAWSSGGKFEKVKGGGKQMDDPANKGPQLSLGNKYTALQGGTE